MRGLRVIALRTVITPGRGQRQAVDVSQRYVALMARLGWSDEFAPEAMVLLDLVTAAETYRGSAVRNISIIEGTAARLRDVFGQVYPRNGVMLAGTAAEADQAMAAFMAAAGLLERFLSRYGVAE
jgi:hypothetical protein